MLCIRDKCARLNMHWFKSQVEGGIVNHSIKLLTTCSASAYKTYARLRNSRLHDRLKEHGKGVMGGG